MKNYTVKQPGGGELTFKGVLLGSATDRPMGCQARTKWNEIDIYRTQKGEYVVVIFKQSLWQGEEHAFLCKSPEEVKSALDTHSRGQGEDNLESAAEKALQEAGEKDETLKIILEQY